MESKKESLEQKARMPENGDKGDKPYIDLGDPIRQAAFKNYLRQIGSPNEAYY